MLDEQHTLLADLAAGPLRDALVATLCRHLSAEEQYLYPAVRGALPGGDALADRELAADRQLRVAARSPELGELIAGHVRRCERELFPRLRRSLDEVALIRLGNRVEIALEAAPSRPHPGLPDRPPLNKWVDPLVGAVDKARDALARRVTYPEDVW
ncbi:MAG: hypothetical protein V7603_5471 [Micromonosporaceae bacterium]